MAVKPKQREKPFAKGSRFERPPCSAKKGLPSNDETQERATCGKEKERETNALRLRASAKETSQRLRKSVDRTTESGTTR